MEPRLVAKSPKLLPTFESQPPRLVRWGFHSSPYKPLFIGVTEDGALCRLAFANGRNAAALLQESQKAWPKTTFVKDQAVTAEIAARLVTGQGELKIAMTGTKFQQAVWKEMLKIPPGKVLTYAEVAKRIKNPKAVRAVGTACGANPVAIIVPCHRIVGSNGGLGGFGGGLPMKRLLLEHEGALTFVEKKKAA